MKKEWCDAYRKQIVTSPIQISGSLFEQEDPLAQNRLFHKNYDGWDSSTGFGAEYARPLSMGGRYCTKEEINDILKIGIGYGQWKAKGGYAQSIYRAAPHAIVRSKSGKEMIYKRSTWGGSATPPDDGKSNRTWASLRPKPIFVVNGDYYGWYDSYQYNIYVEDPQLIEIPQTLKPNVDVVYLGKIYGGPGCFQLSHLIYLYNKGRYTDWFTFFSHGTVRLVAALYEDIYTNPDHANDYIIVGMGRVVSSSNRTTREWASTIFPMLRKHQEFQRYYLFIEYDDGADEQFAESFYVNPLNQDKLSFRTPVSYLPSKGNTSRLEIGLHYNWFCPRLLASQW